MLNIKQLEKIKPYLPNPEIRQEISQWYNAFSKCRNLKSQSYRYLGNISLENFWQIGNDNYDVIMPVKSKSDWKRQAKMTITRDKANGFISKLAKQLIFPQIIAQNNNQEIDYIVSRIFRTLLEWWEYLSKGIRVFIDAVHKCVIEGTIHVQIDVLNGKEIKTVIPNSEIYIPNFYQPDIQKQAYVLRVQTTTWEEAKMYYGDNSKWDYVMPGSAQLWTIQDSDFKKNVNVRGLKEDEVQIIHCWEHGGYDNKGNPKPKKYKVLINGVKMDLPDELPFKHNLYNLAKTVFEKFSDESFYWGNSLPNKIKYDQSYGDAFKTIILNKAILNLLKPLMNKSGEYIDEDVAVPGKVTPTQAEKDDIYVIDGIADPISVSDINVLNSLILQPIDEGTQAPQSMGQSGNEGAKTLGEIELRDYRSAELLEIFGKMMSFLVEDMAEISVSNIIQFMIKSDIEKVVDTSNADILFKKTINVPNTSLSGGQKGVMSINFTPKKQQPSGFDLLRQEMKYSERTGQKTEIIHIDPDYINDFKFFFKILANPVQQQSQAMEQMLALEKYNTIYRNNPIIDQTEAVRTVIKINGDDEDKLIISQPAPMPQQQPGGRITPMTTRLKQSVLPKVQTNLAPV